MLNTALLILGLAWPTASLSPDAAMTAEQPATTVVAPALALAALPPLNTWTNCPDGVIVTQFTYNGPGQKTLLIYNDGPGFVGLKIGGVDRQLKLQVPLYGGCFYRVQPGETITIKDLATDGGQVSNGRWGIF